MEPIQAFFGIDFIQFIFTTLIIMSGITSIVMVVGKFAEFIGKPIKWFNRNNKDHDLLIQTVNNVAELQSKHHEDIENMKQAQKENNEQSIRHDKEIKEDLKILKDMFLDKEVNDMRWEIIDFCSALSNGRKYTKEAFEHVFRIYEKYEKILTDNKLQNGYVEESMNFAREMYVENLKKGSFL